MGRLLPLGGPLKGREEPVGEVAGLAQGEADKAVRPGDDARRSG